MKEEILCLTEIMDRKSICTDISYKWRIIVYKHLEDLPDTGGSEWGGGGPFIEFEWGREGGGVGWALINFSCL